MDFVQIKYFLLTNRIVPIYYPPVVTPIGFPLPDPLNPSEEDEFTRKYLNWKILNSIKPGVPGDYIRELYRFYEFRTYDEAWKFILKVDEKGIRPCNHHPRWQNTYNRVEFWLCTFNIGHKPSQRDVRLAEIIEKIWDEFILN